LAVFGCSTPAEKANRSAQALGFTREVVSGEPFRHLFYFNEGASNGSVLHVYIEHDGSPWLHEQWVSADPTPRSPVMLELMGNDAAPSVYLGRPCYFQVDSSPPCSAQVWTHGRFSEQVVHSMTAALHGFIVRHGYRGIVLLGYSGGGTLATLLAERLPQTLAVVTVAGNLDIEHWAALHDYSPLAGSLNPVARPALPDTVLQRHYVGSRDQRVPPAIARAFARTHPAATVIEEPEFDHICCWKQLWPKILADLKKGLGKR
jgi:hypothetical protein